MTVCTPHSYAGPQECPYCQRDAAQAEVARVRAWSNEQTTRDAARIAELERENAELEASIASMAGSS